MQKYLNKDNLCALLCLLVVVFTVRSAKAEFPTVFAFPDLSAGTKQEEPPKDTEPPVISASDFEITEGDTVSYKKHITVTDNMDEDPVIDVDNSSVDTETPGQYEVTYTVSDHSGNQSMAKITLTVKEKVYNFDEDADEWLSHEAKLILKEILTDDMNDMQKGYAIYRWTKKHISYSSTSDKSDYRIGARDGFRKRRGDCFTYFSVAKVLLDEAGIQNIDVVKLRKSKKESRHYWSLINVGTGWYHFDCTEYRYPRDNFFMVTDSELKKWDQTYYKNAHRYDPSNLPQLATESVQWMIKYSSPTLKLPEQNDSTESAERTESDDNTASITESTVENTESISQSIVESTESEAENTIAG